MRRAGVALTTILFLGVGACSGNGNTEATSAPMPSTPSPMPSTDPAPPTMAGDPPATYSLADLTISLERTACFGFCPEYQVEVSGGGSVRYNGVSNVRTSGAQRATIDRSGVERLLRAFYEVDFFALRDRYETETELMVRPDGQVQAMEMQVTDLPTRILMVRIGDYEKRVVDYIGAPQGVSELAELIDEVAGTDRWIGGDDVEPPTGTVIVANMSENSVWFVDAATGALRGSIETRAAPHEVAVSSDGRWAAVTNYGGQGAVGNLVQILDVRAGTVVREWEVAGYQRLHGAAYLPGDSLLALTSERTGEILVVSAGDGAIRSRLPTQGGTPHMLALGGPWIFAANMGTGTVSRMNPGDPSATSTYPAGIGSRTEGVAATPDGREVWTASMETGMVVGVDGERGEVVARIEGLQVPYRLAATPDGRRILVSDPEAQEFVVIDREAGRIETRLDIRASAIDDGVGAVTSPQGFIVSPDSRWAFIAVQGINQVAVVDLESLRVTAFHQAGAAPDGIAFSPIAG